MHKAISILLASGLLLVCTGCGLLEREYVQISQHQEQTAENDDATTLRAESYAELVGGAQYFVSMGVPSGTVRLYQYTGDIQKAVDRACEALLQDDPLGSYALQDVQCQYTRIVSYYECVFTYQGSDRGHPDVERQRRFSGKDGENPGTVPKSAGVEKRQLLPVRGVSAPGVLGRFL